MTAENVKMVMIDGTVVMTPTESISVHKATGWKILDEMKIAELKKLVTDKGAEVKKGVTKKELLDLL